MARLDELDPRWIVKDRLDGANVNSWHWSEKDVTAEAKRLLRRWVSAREVLKEEEVVLRLLEVRGEVEGEATALNRRGKQGVFFDFDVTVEWQGDVRDRFGYQSCDANGTLKFNVDQQTLDDFDVAVELESLKMPGVDGLLVLLRTKGVAALRNLVKQFFEELRVKHDPRAARERAALEEAERAAQQALQEKLDAQRLEEEAAFLEAQKAGAAAAKEKRQQSALIFREAAAEKKRKKEEERALLDKAIAEAAAEEKEKKKKKKKEEEEEEGAKRKTASAAEANAATAAAAAAQTEAAAAAEEKPLPKKQKKQRLSDEELLAFITGGE